VAKIITMQIPRFRARPYLADASALSDALDSGLVTSLAGDFCWSLNFSTEFVGALCYEGLLPICCELGGGTGLYVLLPKLHAERCILAFDRLHVSRKVRQRAKQFVLTANADIAGVLRGCISQHGESWLYPPLRKALCDLAAADAAALPSALEAPHTEASAPSRCAATPPCDPHAANAPMPTGAEVDVAVGEPPRVHICSFELRRDGQLVGGEVGCIVGCGAAQGARTVARAGWRLPHFCTVSRRSVHVLLGIPHRGQRGLGPAGAHGASARARRLLPLGLGTGACVQARDGGGDGATVGVPRASARRALLELAAGAGAARVRPQSD